MSVSEFVLLKRFVTSGDAEAFAEIIRQHAPLVYGVCLRILADRDMASDAVQDTFLQLVRNADSITGSLPNWLHRVAKNRSIELIRQDSSRKQHEKTYSSVSQNDVSQEEVATWQEISTCIDEELENLDELTREVIILHFFESQTMACIAEKFGISQPTVSRRIEEGITILRHNLKSRGVIVVTAALTALLTENIVTAAPAFLMKELGKIALSGGRITTTVKIATGLSAIKTKIIAVAVVTIIVGSATWYYNSNGSENSVDYPQTNAAFNSGNKSTLESKKFTCTGNVVDAQVKPIAGAKVTVYEMWSDGIAGNMYLKKSGELTTAENGTFLFSTDSKPEKSTFIWSYVVAAKANLSLGWSIWTMKEDMKQNITLGKPEIIEGVIIDESGKPVAGANVRANLTGTTKDDKGIEKKEWLPGIPPFNELITQTDDKGRFHIDNLPSDTSVDLLVRAAGKATLYTLLPGPPEEPAFRTGQTDIKVSLPDEAKIEGKIINPDTGEGAAGLKFAVIYTGSGLSLYRFVCQTDDNGNFNIGGLLNSEYLIRGTSLPFTNVDCTSGRTANVTIKANKLFYGRITYEDDSSVIIKPEPWEDAQTTIDFIVDGENIPNRVDIDDMGYFKAYISQEQYEKIQSGKAWFEIMIPSTYTTDDNYLHRLMHMNQVFAIDLLSTDKGKAGVAKIPKPKQKFISLLGKYLPDFNDIKIDYSIKQAQGKMILICFFDIEQRPSRNCIIEINKKVQALKAQKIEIIAIQASSLEQKQLDEWVKENNISLPVGTIESNQEQTLSKWGAKAFPWLILADKNHKVIAEGFSISEVDEKIKNSTEK